MMAGKGKWLTCLCIKVLYVGYCVHTDLCPNTNLRNFMKCEHGQYLEERCYRTFLDTTLFSCVRECFLRPNRCQSINYLRLFKVCHICEGTLSSRRFTKKSGSIACDVMTSGLDNPFAECAAVNCSWKERCIITETNPVYCQLSECDIPEHLSPYGLGNKPIETKLGTRLPYQCPYFAADKPFVTRTCTDAGVWTDEPCTLTKPTQVTASQSSIALNAGPFLAVDGNKDNNFHHYSCSHTLDDPLKIKWWQVKFPQTVKVSLVKIWNRGDCCGERLNNINIVVENSAMSTAVNCTFYDGPADDGEILDLPCRHTVIGDIVRIEKHQLLNGNIDSALILCEVEVY